MDLTVNTLKAEHADTGMVMLCLRILSCVATEEAPRSHMLSLGSMQACLHCLVEHEEDDELIAVGHGERGQRSQLFQVSRYKVSWRCREIRQATCRSTRRRGVTYCTGLSRSHSPDYLHVAQI